MKKICFSIIVVFILYSCTSQTQHATVEEVTVHENTTSSNDNHLDLMKGFNFTGTSYKMEDYSTFDTLRNLGCNWISFSPFCYMPHRTESDIKMSFSNQWFGESTRGIEEYTDSAHSRNLKVLINPHIWIMKGGFTGNIDLSESDEKIWQKNYQTFILKYAKICESHQVEMMSLGNELKTPIQNDPMYWSNLIDTVRSVYKGQLTYASNWDNVSNVPFWDQLDFISVNAYFPLNNEEKPSKEQIKSGWYKWSKELDQLKKKYDKKVIFTELGYQSVAHCCDKPWEYGKSVSIDESCQDIAYQAFFETVYGKQVGGVFIWKWFDEKDNHRHDHYSPQDKKALETIRKNFK